MLYRNKDRERSYDQLQTIEVPTLEELREFKRNKKTGVIPEGCGNRWAPKPHAQFVDEVRSAAAEKGFQITEEVFQVSPDEHDLYAYCEILVDAPWAEALRIGNKSEEGFRTLLGYRASNVQRFAEHGITGIRITVCANGCFSGEFCFGHKRTNGAVEFVHIRQGMERWEEQAKTIQRQVDRMREITLTQSEADHALVEGYRRDCYSAAKIGQIADTYAGYAQDDSPYQEAFGPRTGWSLYNAVTERAKAWSPTLQEKGLRRFPDTLLALSIERTEYEATPTAEAFSLEAAGIGVEVPDPEEPQGASVWGEG